MYSALFDMLYQTKLFGFTCNYLRYARMEVIHERLKTLQGMTFQLITCVKLPDLHLIGGATGRTTDDFESYINYCE